MRIPRSKDCHSSGGSWEVHLIFEVDRLSIERALWVHIDLCFGREYYVGQWRYRDIHVRILRDMRKYERYARAWEEEDLRFL